MKNRTIIENESAVLKWNRP